MQAVLPANGDGALIALEQSSSEAAVIANLRKIGAIGADYADAVARYLGNPSQEVVAAAIEALGGMGPAAGKFADLIAAGLANENPKVKLAAAGALGQLGDMASRYGEQLLQMISSAKPADEAAKVVAIQALGLIGATAQAEATAKFLNDASPDVQGAACLALSAMGDVGVEKAKDIAKMLDAEGTRSSAITALSYLGAEACAPYVNEIVSKCLTDKDLQTRAEALNALSLVEPEKVLEKAGAKLLELLSVQDPAPKAAAALALGNMGEVPETYVAAVQALLSDEAEDVSWLPLQVGGASTRSPMALRKPKCAAIVALGSIKGKLQDVADLMKDNDWEVRFCAVEAVANFQDAAKDLAPSVAELMDDETYPVRAKACFCLGVLNATDQVDKLSELLEDKTQCVRAEAASAMAAMGEAASNYGFEICHLLSDVSNNVRAAAANALGSLGEGGKPYASVLAGLLVDPAPDVRSEVALALGKMDKYGAAFAEDVSYLLQDPDGGVRAAAAQALGMMGDEALPFTGSLLLLQRDADGSVAEAAMAATKAIGV